MDLPDRAARTAMLQKARAQDPSIEEGPGDRLLQSCLEIIAEDPNASADEVARRCIVRNPEADASWAISLARVAAAPSSL